MKIGVIGAGRIGGNCARQAAKAGHGVLLSFARDPSRLDRLAGRPGNERIVQWVCGDDDEAKATVATLIEQLGYVPVDLGGVTGCAVMEAPRRDGAVYGEEYRVADAQGVVDAVRAGRPIPPTP